MKIYDKILAVDGTTVYYWNQFSTMVKESGGKKLSLLIEREGKRMAIEVTPIMDGGRYVIGIEPYVRLDFKKYGFLESVQLGFTKTLEIADLTFITLKKLLTFSLSIKTLGGPVMIAQMSGQAAAAGLSAFIALMATISLSLGILNLLPIPVLDGGHLVFYTLEMIFRRPVSFRVREIAQQVGLVLLISLMMLAFYNDIIRYFLKQG